MTHHDTCDPKASPSDRPREAEEPLEEPLASAIRAFMAEPTPDLVPLVSARIALLRHDAVPGRQKLARLRAAVGAAIRFLWAPRPMLLRPVWGLAGAAAIAAVFSVTPWEMGEGAAVGTHAQPPAEVRPIVYVQFHLPAPGAESVALAGSFTGWEPRYPLHETSPGNWRLSLPLSPGVHEYAFVIDGEKWVVDPHEPTAEDGLGGRNNRLTLLAPEAGRAL